MWASVIDHTAHWMHAEECIFTRSAAVKRQGGSQDVSGNKNGRKGFAWGSGH
jgi:hypothetical protein